MAQNGWRWLGGAAAVLGGLGLAGCQAPALPPGRSLLAPSTAGEVPRITAAQMADAQIALGRAAERRGDLDEAMLAYQEALRRDAHRADACLRTAVLLDKQGKFRDSAEWYRRALEADPGDPEIYCDMGYSLYLQRRWAEAEMNLRQALAARPDHARAHSNLALVLAHDGRPDEALAEFRKAGCDPAAAHSNLAFALTMDRRWAEARDHYRRALAAAPAPEAAEAARARLAELDALVARVERRGGPLDRDVATASATMATTPAAPATNPAATRAAAGRPREAAAVAASAFAATGLPRPAPPARARAQEAGGAASPK